MSEDIVAMAREALHLTMPPDVSIPEYVNRLFTAYVTLNKTVPEILDRLKAAEQVVEATETMLNGLVVGYDADKTTRQMDALSAVLDAYHAAKGSD